MKVPKRSADGELYMHVHKKFKRNQNEDGDNRRSLWQREWNHFLAFVCVGSRLVLNDNYHCMCYCHQSMLHQIYTSRIGNDNICQGTKIVSSDDNIHSSLCVAGKRWKPSLYTSDVIVAIVFWNVLWATMCSLLHEQCNKWIPKSLMVWSHLHREKHRTIVCGIPRWIRNVVKKWAEDKQNEGVLWWTKNQAPIARPTQERRHEGLFFQPPWSFFFGLLQQTTNNWWHIMMII